MIYYLSLELKKTKRRGIWLVLAVLFLVITAWAGHNMNDERFLEYGWLMTLFNVPLLNAILIPTAIAVFASRIIDMEHKGNTWKMLETLQRKFDIYLTKVLYGLIAILIFSLSELIAFLAMGTVVGFKGTPDLWAYGLFFVQTFVISFNLYLLQMIISMVFSNQAVALCTGLCGSMAGLFLMYVPQWPLLRNLVPWGHYGASMFVGMDAAKNQINGFYYMNQENGCIFFIAGWLVLLLTGGWFVFRKMDTDGYHFPLKSHGRRENANAGTKDSFSESHKPVRIPHLPVELIKIKRTPVWIAFLILPLISALIGTANYLNNLGLLTSTWYSLWTQHSLFFCYFFMPPLVGVYASYLWRLEHSGSNWNMVLVNIPAWRLVFDKIAVCSVITFLTLGWLCLLYILCGLYAGFTEPVPAELAEWFACGVLGGVAVCAIQCFLSLVIRSFAIPIGLALLGGFAGLAATAKSSYYLLPYSLMSRGMRANNPNLAVDAVEFISYSVFFIVLFYLLSVCYIRSHDVKTQ
ncbi:MAG: ABC transporter permease [Lachnospiraceae bacterium]|nr:ABC transporter permease [Lachnospiraceae bacterium]